MSKLTNNFQFPLVDGETKLRDFLINDYNSTVTRIDNILTDLTNQLEELKSKPRVQYVSQDEYDNLRLNGQIDESIIYGIKSDEVDET